MGDLEQRSAVRRAVEDAWADGCPVAEGADGIVDVAMRRWDSSSRRKVDQADFDRRIEDLAKGLVQRMERNPRAVGRLMEDYRFLARKIAEAVSAATDRE